MQIPDVIKNRMEELNRIVEQYPQYIPVPIAAKYIGASKEGLRDMIFKGNCPFGIAWQRDLNGNRVFKIPTLKFYLWFSNNGGIYPTGLEEREG